MKTTQSLRDAVNVAARITGGLPLSQEEYCTTCHSGTRIYKPGHGEPVVVHNPGCTSDPTTERNNMSDTATTTGPANTSVDNVRAALEAEPRPLSKLVTDLRISATTARKALKTLGAVQGTDGTWTIPGAKPPAAAPAKKAAAKKAPAAKKAAAVKEPRPEGAAGPRSREEAQRRDAHVLATLAQHKDGLTREQLKEASGAGDLTYMSLWRLNKAGKVTKTTGGSRQPVWTAKA